MTRQFYRMRYKNSRAMCCRYIPRRRPLFGPLWTKLINPQEKHVVALRKICDAYAKNAA